MTKNQSLRLLVAATGLAVGVASVSSAALPPGSPFLINLSGATLLSNFLSAPASTNEFVTDLNGDTVISGSNRQLAPTGIALTVPNQLWQVQVRGTGSINGLIELRDFGRVVAGTPVFALGGDGVDLFSSRAAENAWHNRTVFINAGVIVGGGLGNVLNPGADPRRSLKDGTYSVTTSAMDTDAGVHVDISPLDVHITWGIQYPGTPNEKAVPGPPGYGTNSRFAVNKDGTTTSQQNSLPTLYPFENVANTPLNLNYSTPDANTVYSSPNAYSIIAPITSYGTGYQQMTYTQMKWLFTSGRLPNGENLMAVTRDIGSGTRNGFMNAICTDPSFGVGENVGPFTSSSATELLGANFQPSNKGGSGRVEGTMKNHRLAVGYVGAERGINNGWLTGHQFECLGVKNDLNGGTVFARPTITNIINNDANGFNIFGPGTFATIGDPRAASAAYGGDANGHPAMANSNAAAYVNNITKSLEAVKAVPGGDQTVFSPGEFLAANYVLYNATHFGKDLTNPCSIVVNGAYNPTLAQYVIDNSVLANPLYATFSAGFAGLVPARTSGVTYTDGVAGGGNYKDQNGANVAYGAVLSLPNKISGDFDQNGARNKNDIMEMMKAYRARNGGPAWNAGSNLVIEILGDFNGDGNFDRRDIRYFADGLAIDPANGNLNRCMGFMLVDQAWQTLTGNADFFGSTIDFGASGMPAATVLATGTPYVAGDSVGDVSGPGALHTRGFSPIGQDGRVDARDIDYVRANFGSWSSQTDAVRIDLSADINGDLVVDQRDVCKIVVGILKTRFGDVNLDGVVNNADLTIANAHINLPGGWADGDVNGDGVVDAADVAVINNGGANICCPADLNLDGVVNAADLALLLGSWGVDPAFCCPANLNGDSGVNATDLALVLGSWGVCPQ